MTGRSFSPSPPKASSSSSPPHEVRIIGGQWKRSKLPVADAAGLRPTPDRVRETLFNWLGQDLTGWRCLDAFAGSGALGFEAASRGAGEVVLIERDRRLAAALNLARTRLRAEGSVRVECADALAWMARSAAPRGSATSSSPAFELIFIDPPFGSPLAAPALMAAMGLVVQHGFIYLESGDPFDLASSGFEPGLRVHRQGRAGAVHFHLLQAIGDVAAKSPGEEPPPDSPDSPDTAGYTPADS